MKRILSLLLVMMFLITLVGCDSDPNNINGKYIVNGYQTAAKGESAYKWESLTNDQFYVVIEKAKIVTVYLNGTSYTGNFEDKGNAYNTTITWGSGNGPGSQIFDGWKIFHTNIGFTSNGELHLTIYMSYSSSASEWTQRATIRFEKEDKE